MKNKSNYTELVQRYLYDELSAQELDAFEKELKQSKYLREELNLQKKIDQFIQDDELENFNLELNQVYDKLVKKGSKKRRLNFRRLSLIAASIIVLFTLGIVFLNNVNDRMSCDEIFDEYYQGYMPTYKTRSLITCSVDSLFKNAIDQYNSMNYQAAEVGFLSVINTHSKNIASRFYLGVVYIELEKYSKAIDSFNEVIATKDQYYQEQSEWYKALCFIKLNDKTAAAKQLQAIVARKGYCSEQADEILLKLD